MRAMPIPVVLLSVAISVAACSSKNASRQGADGGNRAGTGGSIASGGTSSKSGATGAGGTTGSGGADPALCQADSGADECRRCLASQCCGDLVLCFSDSGCRSSFDEYQRCVKRQKGDPNAIADCYSAFIVGLQDAGSQHLGLTTCDYLDCSSECGAPSMM